MAQRPHTKAALFWSFTRIALQGFGGVIAIAQRELVETRQWLTAQEFVDDWAVSQVLPGPNVVNLSIILGDRFFGWRGALAAVAGMLMAPTAVVLCLAALFANYAGLAVTQGMMRGVACISAGLIAGVVLRMLNGLSTHMLGLWPCLALFASTFFAVALLRLPLVWVLLPLGGVGIFFSLRILKREKGKAP